MFFFFLFLKKNQQHCSVSATVCWTGKCDGNDWSYSFFFFLFFPVTFSTDNSFHGRLASDLRLPLSLFNLGGVVAAEEGMDVFLAGQQCGG